jgi:hypothetical protein
MKQFVIATLLAATQAADCKDAYTDLADGMLDAATKNKAALDAMHAKAVEV